MSQEKLEQPKVSSSICFPWISVQALDTFIFGFHVLYFLCYWSFVFAAFSTLERDSAYFHVSIDTCVVYAAGTRREASLVLQAVHATCGMPCQMQQHLVLRNKGALGVPAIGQPFRHGKSAWRGECTSPTGPGVMYKMGRFHLNNASAF
jgi:hypothetical protein